MGLFDRLFGEQEPQRDRPSTTPPSEDERAIQRYRYLLETAPPEAIERVHEEAFAKLSPEQRRRVLADLSAGLPEGERPRSDDPQAMARAATRGEVSQPGFLQQTLGGGAAQGGGPSFGAMVGGSLLGTVAGYVIGSAIVSPFLPPVGFDGGAADGAGADTATTDAAAADAGGYDVGGADAGGDFGGDVGGADFGGGDFGGGDFGGF